jgi:acetylornithine deacetylase/succinyl-diaminopimelate desuccinylase family protein
MEVISLKEKDLLEKLCGSVSKQEIVDLTRKLIRIPSHWDVPTLEREMVDELIKYCDDNGLDYKLQPVDGQRSNIIVRLPGSGGGKSLALNGHLDTVPPYNMTVEPFEAKVDGNRIYGRGAVDMKGPVATMLATILAFKRSGIKLKGDLIFTGVLAEETNSDGSETLISSGFRADGAIVGEPSNYEYAIAHRGLEWIEFEIIGKSAHGGIPNAGVNAIVNAAKFIMRVQERVVPRLRDFDHPYMGPSVMNFGRIEGGTQPSTVADRCIIQIDRRYTTAEELKDVLQEYEDILKELSEEDPSFKGVMRRMPSSIMKQYDHVPMETSPDHPLVYAVKETIEYITDAPPKLTTRRGWTDAAILNFYGKIPTVVYGPGDISRSHSPSEYITVEELYDGFRAYCLIAMKFCGLA